MFCLFWCCLIRCSGGIWFFLQEHSQSFFLFPKTSWIWLSHEIFFNLPCLFIAVAVNFPLLLPPFSSLHFVLSFFLCWRMSCPPTVQTNLLCWGSLLRQGPIFNQMFCKQKEYSFSRTLLTRTFLWLSLLSDLVSAGISVSPKRAQTVHGLHSTAALLLPSLLSLDSGSAKILSLRMGGVVTNCVTLCSALISCTSTNTFPLDQTQAPTPALGSNTAAPADSSRVQYYTGVMVKCLN